MQSIIGTIVHWLDGFDHVESHLDGAVGMVGSGVGQSADAVVAVAEQLDAQTGVVGGQFVEPREQLVQHAHQFLSRALRTESREAADVREQYATRTRTVSSPSASSLSAFVAEDIIFHAAG